MSYYDDDDYYCDPVYQCCESDFNPWDGWATMQVIFVWAFAGSIAAAIIPHIATLWLPRLPHRRPMHSGRYTGFFNGSGAELELFVRREGWRRDAHALLSSEEANIARQAGDMDDCCECSQSKECGRGCIEDECCFDACCNNCFCNCFCNDCCGKCFNECFCGGLGLCDPVGVQKFKIARTSASPPGVSDARHLVMLPETIIGPAGLYQVGSYCDRVMPCANLPGKTYMAQAPAPELEVVVSEQPRMGPLNGKYRSQSRPQPRARVRNFEPLYVWMTRASLMVTWMLMATFYVLWVATTLELWRVSDNDDVYDSVVMLALPFLFFCMLQLCRAMAPGASWWSEWANTTRVALLVAGVMMAVSAAYSTQNLAIMELANHSNCGLDVCEAGECGCYVRVGFNGQCRPDQLTDHADACYSAAVDDDGSCDHLKGEVLDLLWLQSMFSTTILALMVACMDFAVLPRHFSNNWGECCGSSCNTTCLSTIMWQIVAFSIFHQRRIIAATMTFVLTKRPLWVPRRLMAALALPFDLRVSQLPFYGDNGPDFGCDRFEARHQVLLCWERSAKMSQSGRHLTRSGLGLLPKTSPAMRAIVGFI